MKQRQLQQIIRWFDKYVAGFYGSDEYVNANLKMKECHSRRVCEEAVLLAKKLELDDQTSRLVHAASLLHDVGRFEQFTKYNTYNDTQSTNHCLLGVEVTKKSNALQPLDEYDRQLILKTIEYHGVIKLPDDLEEPCLNLCKIVRDADKIDIYHVVTTNFARYKADPENFDLELEFPDDPVYTPEIVTAVLNEQRIDYANLNTLIDMRIQQLAWVYDVNYVETLKTLKQRKLLEKMADFLPENQTTEKIKRKIFSYINQKTTKTKPKNTTVAL